MRATRWISRNGRLVAQPHIRAAQSSMKAPTISEVGMPKNMGADPAFLPTASSQQAVSTKGFNPGDVWLTDETPPRRLVVEGTAGLDPDWLVANFEDGSEGYRGKTLWIVKHSGYVV